MPSIIANVPSASNARSRHSSRSASRISTGVAMSFAFLHRTQSNVPRGCDSFHDYWRALLVAGLLTVSACGSGDTTWGDYCADLNTNPDIAAAIDTLSDLPTANPADLDSVDAMIADTETALATLGRADIAIPDELAYAFDTFQRGTTSEGAPGSEVDEAMATVVALTDEHC